MTSTLTVAQDLTAITQLAHDLHHEATHHSDDPHIPGAQAMLQLAPVASPEAWEHRIATLERLALNGQPYPTHAEDAEDAAVPLQALLYWSEAWRAQHGRETDLRPTLTTEAHFLRGLLDWASDHEPHWADFARDVHRARTQLEDTLRAGHRVHQGVQCFDCQRPLIRPTRERREPRHCTGHDGICYLPHSTCPHDRGGLEDHWQCPSCGRRYDADAYQRAVSQAHFLTAPYLPLAEAIERTGAPSGSIRGWATKGRVKRRKDDNTGRVVYCVTDILNAQDGATRTHTLAR